MTQTDHSRNKKQCPTSALFFFQFWITIATRSVYNHYTVQLLLIIIAILLISVVTLSAPTNLAAIVTCNQFQLSWTQPGDLLEGYSIHNYTVGKIYAANDTIISINSTDAELAINGVYNVSVTPSYCRGEGMTAYTTVVIANSELNGSCTTFVHYIHALYSTQNFIIIAHNTMKCV